jgi:hypothetical protein
MCCLDAHPPHASEYSRHENNPNKILLSHRELATASGRQLDWNDDKELIVKDLLINRITGNWQLSSILRYETGNYLTVVTGRDKRLEWDRWTIRPFATSGSSARECLCWKSKRSALRLAHAGRSGDLECTDFPALIFRSLLEVEEPRNDAATNSRLWTTPLLIGISPGVA